MHGDIAEELLIIGCYLEETEADFRTHQAWCNLRDDVTKLMMRVLQLQEMVKSDISEGMQMNRKISYISGNKAGIKEDPMKEGIIEVRPGTKGIDLGDRKWCMAYIRVLDDSHYFKGMCIYSNDLPDDYDVICYFRDPSHGLKMLKTVTPELDIGNGIMTKLKTDTDEKWDIFADELRRIGENGRRTGTR